jgi:hypothetical protein
VRRARADWGERQRHMRARYDRLVFIDESSVRTGMTRLCGRAPRGQRLTGTTTFSRRQTQTFIAGLACDRLLAPWVIPGALDRQAFDTWIETQLAPALAPGTVVRCGLEPMAAHASLLDNLSVHKSRRAAAILAECGCWLLPLPPYSPDLNPIEMAFAKLKAHLKRIGARTFDTLLEAIGDICNLFSPDECSNYFRHARYLST